jgi:predicted XRE-type DNA-binding protein
MLVPSSYLAYSLYREQQFKKNADLFIESEFTQKGYTIVYKKTDFNPKAKKLELAFLSRRFSALEIKELKEKLNQNKYLAGTELQIRQDSTDRFNALKGDILSQIKSSENEMNVKDVKIMQLEKQLTRNKFDNRQILNEILVLFPDVNSLSINKTALVNQKDSTVTITAVIYDSTKILSGNDTEKLKMWLNERLSVKDVELFRKH